MATLAILAWLCAAYFFMDGAIMMFLVDKNSGNSIFITPKPIAVMWLFLHVILVGLLGSAIHWDLFSKLPVTTSTSRSLTADAIQSRLVFGLVALGVTATSAFLARQGAINPKSQKVTVTTNTQNTYAIGKTTVEVIGVISSILGIIAFYLDYLR